MLLRWFIYSLQFGNGIPAQTKSNGRIDPAQSQQSQIKATKNACLQGKAPRRFALFASLVNCHGSAEVWPASGVAVQQF